MGRYFNGLFQKAPFSNEIYTADGSLLAKPSNHMLNSSMIIEFFGGCFNRLETLLEYAGRNSTAIKE